MNIAPEYKICKQSSVYIVSLIACMCWFNRLYKRCYKRNARFSCPYVNEWLLVKILKL